MKELAAGRGSWGGLIWRPMSVKHGMFLLATRSKVTSCHQNGDQGPLGPLARVGCTGMGFPVCLSLPWPIVTPVVSPPKLLYSSWATLLFFQHIAYTQRTSSSHCCANMALHALHTLLDAYVHHFIQKVLSLSSPFGTLPFRAGVYCVLIF